jgi:hypothetical protein
MSDIYNPVIHFKVDKKALKNLALGFFIINLAI